MFFPGTFLSDTMFSSANNTSSAVLCGKLRHNCLRHWVVTALAEYIVWLSVSQSAMRGWVGVVDHRQADPYEAVWGTCVFTVCVTEDKGEERARAACSSRSLVVHV